MTIKEKSNINSSVSLNQSGVQEVTAYITRRQQAIWESIKQLVNLENAFFPIFTKYLTSTIQNCLQCLQLKRVPSKNLTTPLQPVFSLKSHPGEMLQVDSVSLLQSPLYRYVLTGIDVFTEHLFAVPLTNHQKLLHEKRRFFSVKVTFQKQSYQTWVLLL